MPPGQVHRGIRSHENKDGYRHNPTLPGRRTASSIGDDGRENQPGHRADGDIQPEVHRRDPGGQADRRGSSGGCFSGTGIAGGPEVKDPGPEENALSCCWSTLKIELRSTGVMEYMEMNIFGHLRVHTCMDFFCLVALTG